MAFNVQVVWPRSNQWSARYIIITILFVPLLWHDGYHICLQNLLFRKLAQVRLLGASNYKKKKKKKKKKREEKQKWTEFTDIFFLMAFALYNWAVTFPKQSQNALVRTPNLAFSSKANTTQAQEQQVLCQMKTATNAGATDKHKCKGRERKTWSSSLRLVRLNAQWNSTSILTIVHALVLA